MSTITRIGRVLLIAVGAVLAAAVGFAVFVEYPADLADLLGVLLAIGVALGGARIAGQLVGSYAAPYDVAEVAVDGPISRDGRGILPRRPGGTPADDIVEQIELADADRNARGLLVRLNTPGGQVVPSDDIRRAVEAFEGPTVAYATDVCASGGYWIATGCDRLIARDASLVGSIGVIGSRVNAHELAEKVGLSYERLAAGRFKDAGFPLKEVEADERAYLQGLVDEIYATFVERVADGRDLDVAEIEETEARVYLGEEAAELDLIDSIGDDEDAEAYLAAELGVEEVTVQAFEPQRSLRERIGTGARTLAYAFGAGIAGSAMDRDFDLQLR